ncbi:hypothetical protein ACH436_12460 [Isoptericola sp. NPDC019693]|uniref:hypothetical protein n=1 Tax=Isoptericola sp. NPDC019693 TaxID=3364009 RepID=UPI0037B6977F
MTLIAIGTTPTSARIMTDTWAYTLDATQLAHCTKVVPLLHLDAMVATAGNVAFGDLWAAAAMSGGTVTPDFDQFVAWAPGRLREIGEFMLGEEDEALVLHVGRSAAHGGYVTVAHSSYNDFEPEVLGDYFIHPSPFDSRVSNHEAARIRRAIDGLEGLMIGDDEPWDTTVDRDNLAFMLEQPVGTAPTSTAGWVNLAEKARLHRSRKAVAIGGMKVLVGGKVHLTTLDRQGLTQRVIHEFNDQGDELLEVLRGTDHPLAIAAEEALVDG